MVVIVVDTVETIDELIECFLPSPQESPEPKVDTFDNGVDMVSASSA